MGHSPPDAVEPSKAAARRQERVPETACSVRASLEDVPRELLAVPPSVPQHCLLTFCAGTGNSRPRITSNSFHYFKSPRRRLKKPSTAADWSWDEALYVLCGAYGLKEEAIHVMHKGDQQHPEL